MSPAEVVALDTASKLLAQTGSEQLLTTIETLTHQIHAIQNTTPVDTERLLDKRRMRGLVRAEVLRRMGGAR